MYLIYDECVAMFKEYNVWRHHIEKYQTFWTTFRRDDRRRLQKCRGWVYPTTRAVLFLCTLRCACVSWQNLKGKRWINSPCFSFLNLCQFKICHHLAKLNILVFKSGPTEFVMNSLVLNHSFLSDRELSWSFNSKGVLIHPLYQCIDLYSYYKTTSIGKWQVFLLVWFVSI